MTDLTPRNTSPVSQIIAPACAADSSRVNQDCDCIQTNTTLYREAAAAKLQDAVFDFDDRHAHLVARLPEFLSQDNVDRIGQVVDAVHRLTASPAYRGRVLAGAPETARRAGPEQGVLFGYDFHITPHGPKLIEINTNAGGALIVTDLLRAQETCCPAVDSMIRNRADAAEVERRILESFIAEWQIAGNIGQPGHVAIVDEAPGAQYLYPEMLLFARLFRRAGIETSIAAPEELDWNGQSLTLAGAPIDLVYNRLTDFYLEAPAATALHSAWQAGRVIVTPNPRHHAIYAHKANLAVLGDDAWMAGQNIAPDIRQQLTASVPRAVPVTAANADSLWHERRRWFFKPVAGFGSRGVYRGDKLTRRVWGEICAGGYIAQEYVPPTDSMVVDGQGTRKLKSDIRAYVHDGRIQLLAARRYQGQATNMRTPGGGFASVYAADLSAPQ